MHHRRLLGIGLCGVAGLAFAGLATEFGYRLNLFLHAYGGKAGLNHVGDGTFAMLYGVGLIGTLAAAVAAIANPARLARWVAITAGAANLLACLAFYAMHRAGALVEYTEFCKVYHLG